MRALALLCFVNQVKVDIIAMVRAQQDIVEGGLDLALELPGNILKKKKSNCSLVIVCGYLTYKVLGRSA